ncbi:hypothetical protein H0H93_013060 [Arthromyces matolae]|nr:hypothetical protein H0H93_013060 [Arthromyces matolae]
MAYHALQTMVCWCLLEIEIESDIDLKAAQTTYLLYASDNNQNFKISKLDSNYYSVLSVTSQLTAGPWSSQADIAPSATRTYFSQNAYDLFVNSNLAIYMGDRWRPSLLGSSRYIWFPISWSSSTPQLVQADVWSVNLAAGTYSVATGTSYEAESGTISGSATTLSDSSFSGGKAVGYLGSIHIPSIHLLILESLVNVHSVNGGASVLVDQPNTGGGHVILSVPVKLVLQSGANSITFAAGQSNYAADLDKIIVYTAT